MSVYKIEIARSIYEKIGRGPTSFSDKQKAEEHLENAFKKAKITYVKGKAEQDTTYKNEHGGILAKIVLDPNQPGWRS